MVKLIAEFRETTNDAEQVRKNQRTHNKCKQFVFLCDIKSIKHCFVKKED